MIKASRLKRNFINQFQELNFDYCKRIPKIGETIHGERFNIGFGGKGGNQCVVAAKLGARTAMIAKLGNDLFGENYLKNLLNHEIDTTHVQMVDEMSGVAQITVNENGENNIVIIAGANNELSPVDVEKAESLIEKSNVVLFQFETPLSTTVKALELCKTYSCYTIVNAAPAVLDFDTRILHLSDVFCVNEIEAETVTHFQIKSVPDAKRAAIKLLSLGCKLPIITLGEKGVVFATTGHIDAIHIPVEEVQPVDTTGAGDAFLGAFGFFKSKFSHLSLEDMIKRSCEVAKYSVQKQGTQSSFPARLDLPPALFI